MLSSCFLPRPDVTIVVDGLKNQFCVHPSSHFLVPSRRMEETVPLALSRLMLVLEYLLHHLYDPPPALLEQVQWNLFTVHTLPQGRCQPSAPSPAPHYFHCREVEDNFRKSILSLDASEGGLTRVCVGGGGEGGGRGDVPVGVCVWGGEMYL